MTDPGPTGLYLAIFGVVAGLLVLTLGSVFLGVRLADKRRWARERRARELRGETGDRIGAVLADLAATMPTGPRDRTADDEARPAAGPDVEQAYLQVGGPAV
jgi:hypothetical protein